jgi:hypothetical protein
MHVMRFERAGINRYPCPQNKMGTMCSVRTQVGLVPAEGLLGAAPRPFGVALRAINVASRRCRTRLVCLSGVRIVTDNPQGSVGFTRAILKWVCRLRDSNPRPTVYKTVALPLC